MATAKVIIAGENKIGSAVNEAKNNLSNFGQTAQKVGDVLKKALSVTAVVAAVKKLGDAASACLSDFLQAQRAYKQLSITLGDDAAYKSVTENIVKLSKQTLSSKDQVEAMVSELAALGKSAEDVNKISDAAVYLSNVTGRDLNSSMATLLNTFNGNTVQLRKLGVDTSDLTKKELEQGAAVDLVIEKFGELSTKMAEADTSQHITNIKNNIGDIKQSFGDLVDFSIGPVLAKLDTLTEKIRVSFDDFIQKVKIVFENFPEIFSNFMAALKGSLSHIFSIEGVTQVISGIFSIITSRIQLLGNLFANLFSLVVNVASEALEGIGNYAMYWVMHICDSLGINISEVINSIGTWLTESPIGKIIDNVITGVVNGIRLIGALIKNIPAMVKLIVGNIETVAKNLWISLKGAFFTMLSDMIGGLAKMLDNINFPQMIENVKTAIINIFGRVSSWFTAIGATIKDTFRYIGDLIEVTFSWNSIKTIFTTLFKNIGVLASALIKGIFVSIPEMISSVFEGLVTWFSYAGEMIKNILHDAILSALDALGAPDWLKNFLFPNGKADRTKENELKAKADSSFSNVGSITKDLISDAIDSADVIHENNKAISALYDGIEGINVATSSYEDITAAIKGSGSFVTLLENVSETLASKVEDNSQEWDDISAQFAALLDPVFEKFTMDTGETIGAKLATWTAKSKDDYFAAAKKNFSNIGDFMKDWGQTFLSDLGDDWEGLTSSVSSLFEGMFGEDFGAFLEWFQPFMEEMAKNLGVSTTGTGGKGGTGGGDDEEETPAEKFANSVMNQVTSKLGEAGSVISSFTTNISSMGGALGSTMTLLEFVFDGLAETLGPTLDTLTTLLIEPLKEVGRVVGALLVPLLDMLMPLLAQLDAWIVGLLDTLMTALKPFIDIVVSVISPILQVIASILEALTPVLSFFAKIVIAVTGTIEYVIQGFNHWVAGLLNGLANISIFGWKPFKNLSMKDPGDPGNYKAFMDNKFSAVDQSFDYAKGKVDSWATGETTSTSTSVTSAGYQGATQVTINIYQQAPVVGDGGMRAFAQMIRSEFESMNYYGVVN